ncbi:MAG: phytanoyl-CoA dioxygenase family protein [Candidatus Rokuibacteriota bacterium]
MLTPQQIEQFWADGCLVVPDAVTVPQHEALQRAIAGWIEESRRHAAPFGEPTIDGRPRFDLEAGHTAERPRLRRVNNPSDISVAFEEVMANSRTIDMVTDLIGPDVKFHHCKVNLKLSGTHTFVGYHQDFSYTPHTNDDIVTALIMLDDVTLDNGCLMIVPGSHNEAQVSLFEGDMFTGQASAAETAVLRARAVSVTGPRRSVCLMHTRLAHGSEPNRSPYSRGLYICVYTAADAFPLNPNPMPNRNEGRILRGKKTRIARLMATNIELPAQPKSASFFTVQGQVSAGAEQV